MAFTSGAEKSTERVPVKPGTKRVLGRAATLILCLDLSRRGTGQRWWRSLQPALHTPGSTAFPQPLSAFASLKLPAEGSRLLINATLKGPHQCPCDGPDAGGRRVPPSRYPCHQTCLLACAADQTLGEDEPFPEHSSKHRCKRYSNIFFRLRVWSALWEPRELYSLSFLFMYTFVVHRQRNVKG